MKIQIEWDLQSYFENITAESLNAALKNCRQKAKSICLEDSWFTTCIFFSPVCECFFSFSLLFFLWYSTIRFGLINILFAWCEKSWKCARRWVLTIFRFVQWRHTDNDLKRQNIHSWQTDMQSKTFANKMVKCFM